MLQKRKIDYFLAIFLSTYPIVQLYCDNIDVLKFGQTFIPFFIIFIFSTIIYLTISLKIKSGISKAIIVPIIVIVLFTYNHLHVFLTSKSNFINEIGRNRILIPLILLSLGIFVFIIIKSGFTFKKFLIVFLVVLNFLPYSKLIFRKKNVFQNVINKETNFYHLSTNKEDFPDVFYIVLDMYPSNVVLKKYFNFNNSNFTKQLEELGFKVFINSRSNYSRTLLSLTSTLNMDYLNKDSDSISNDLSTKNLFNKLENGKVQNFFKKLGYNFYWFEGGYLQSKRIYSKNEKFISVSESFLSRKETSDNDFLMYFIDNTIFSPFSERIKILSVEIFRNRINNILFNLPLIANQKDKKFVFAHIISPHPPYVFGENGEKIYYSENGPNRKKIFIKQLKYINKRIFEVLEKMVKVNNGRDKIIIIQGDHGTREIQPNNIFNFTQNWTQEAFGNLNAIYFSDKSKNNTIQYHSSINTFRFILNNEFGQKYTILKDRFYYTDFIFPLKFKRIND